MKKIDKFVVVLAALALSVAGLAEAPHKKPQGGYDVRDNCFYLNSNPSEGWLDGCCRSGCIGIHPDKKSAGFQDCVDKCKKGRPIVIPV